MHRLDEREAAALARLVDCFRETLEAVRWSRRSATVPEGQDARTEEEVEALLVLRALKRGRIVDASLGFWSWEDPYPVLDGRRVKEGDRLEVLRDGGRWLPVTVAIRKGPDREEALFDPPEHEGLPVSAGRDLFRWPEETDGPA